MIEPDLKSTWRSLFTFMTRKHLPVLACGISMCLVNGAIAPLNAIVTGAIFQSFTDLGGELITAERFRHDVLRSVFILIGLAGATCIFGSCLFAIWITFGELQARSARLQLFDVLLFSPVMFYDKLRKGVGAISPRMQT